MIFFVSFPLLIGGLFLVLLLIDSCFRDIPDLRAWRNGTRVEDRTGQWIARVDAEPGQQKLYVPFEAISKDVVTALVAAEDAHFYYHPGIDPLAIARAAVQNIVKGEVFSGASTITQQLVRNLHPVPRNLIGKWREAARALALERRYSKDEILEAYLNVVIFGPHVQGVEAASLYYFARPARRVGLSDAALLVALLRGPSHYNPRRHPERAILRRNWVLERVFALGDLEQDSLESLKKLPLELSYQKSQKFSPHYLQRLKTLGFFSKEETINREGVLRTELDLDLQISVEDIVKDEIDHLKEKHVQQAAVLVVENSTGAILSYVGSVDFSSKEGHGEVDGVFAKRQPGSTLKPFVYELAFEQGRLGAHSILADLPLQLETPAGSYHPQNYDKNFRGPISLRFALGQSLNLPALRVTQLLGVDHALNALKRWGFDSLELEPEHYGEGLVLGDGEVTLYELVRAYSAIARGGKYLDLRFTKDERAKETRQVARPEAIALLSSILSDDRARSAHLGKRTLLHFDFPVAAKTGTSKHSRDNWVLGFSSEVTVGVWVGNFDGSPMNKTSGMTGAAPIFRRVMQSMHEQKTGEKLYDEELLQSAEICTLSGKAPHKGCQHRAKELFLKESLPLPSCNFHQELYVSSNGASCKEEFPESKLENVEILPSEFLEWARKIHQHRTAMPELCPAGIERATRPSYP